MSRSSTFIEVAEDHIRALLAAGQTEQDAAKELGTLAATLAAEGQTEFAQALSLVSRRHQRADPAQRSVEGTQVIASRLKERRTR